MEFDVMAPNTIAISASTPRKPPPISVRTPAAVCVLSTLAPASPMVSTHTYDAVRPARVSQKMAALEDVGFM